jgi:hypothetical protein
MTGNTIQEPFDEDCGSVPSVITTMWRDRPIVCRKPSPGLTPASVAL